MLGSHRVCSCVQKLPHGGAIVFQHHLLFVVLRKPCHSESASSDGRRILNARAGEIRQKINSVYFLNYFKSVHNKRYLLFHIKNCICLEMLKCLCSEMFKLYKGFFESNVYVE